MKIPLIVVFFCISALQVSAVVQVSGHVGGELSIQCFSNWTTNGRSEQYNMYFCKGRCSKENRLVQTERSRPAITQRGRYNMEGNSTDFNVTIKRLKMNDAGRYYCKLERNGTMWSEEVMVTVLEGFRPQCTHSVPQVGCHRDQYKQLVQSRGRAATAPVEFTITVQTANSTLSQDNFSSSLTPSPTLEGSNKEAATLTDTTIVIIVSVSLALLVCAIIPLIFYGHWRSTAENQNTAGANKTGADYCEENADVPLTAVTLQTVDRDTEAEASAQDAAQYASIYQALDPTTLD